MRVVPVIVLALVLLLGACTKQNIFEVEIERCPAVAVVGDFGVVTRFKGASKTTEDIDYTATIRDVSRNCIEGSRVTTDISIDFLLETGPAFDGAPVKIQYFVAVMRDNSLLVSKKYFDLEFTIDSSGKAVIADTIRQVIPDVDQLRRYDYEVLMGFVMTTDEAAYNLIR